MRPLGNHEPGAIRSSKPPRYRKSRSLDSMNSGNKTPAFGGLTPAETVQCGRCGRVIAYDASRSLWLDESGVPGCAPSPDGHILEHQPQLTERMKATLAEPETDPLGQYAQWPEEDSDSTE